MKQKLVIKKSEWMRGAPDSSLVTKDGKRCCLGFLGNQFCNLSDWQMKGFGEPENVAADWPKWLVGVQGEAEDDWSASVHNTPLCWELMDTNDSLYIDDETRMCRLTKAFATVGVDVEFVP